MSCLDAKMVKEIVIIYALLGRGHPVRGQDDRLGEKPRMCRRSGIKPVRKKGKLSRRALTVVVSAAYLDFVTMLKGVF